MLRRIFVLLASAAWLFAADSKPSLDGFDTFAEKTLKDWQCAGFAIAVVQDGKVTFAKGYGMRDQKRNLPVTNKTLFAIGSSTKSFTVSSLAALADQGKLDWDKPVREYLPEFKIYDPFASEQMSARDLVTHRSRLPRHDMMWYNSAHTRKDLVDGLRYLEPSKDFRTTFQYQNLMFLTAGYLAGQIAGKMWEELARERIFTPPAMTASDFSIVDSQMAGEFPLPYRKEEE